MIRKLYVEIADTPQKQATGLMFRNYLPKFAGMLFKFDDPKKLKFWNMNTFIPLDIAFVSSENKITKISRIKPYTKQSGLMTVGSDADCVIAIEANEGFFKSNGIKIGDKIKINKEDDTDIVFFDEDTREFELKDIFN